MTHKWPALWLCAIVIGGCSSANVVKNPGDGDNGIRFYRPKPYLLVTPADATGRMVKLEVLQLQDYSEEYSIHPKGRKPPAVALKDGWNLVAVGGPAPPPDKPEPVAPQPPEMKLPEFVVASSNIPIGLYESVFDSDGRGGKYLKGWRYIGSSVWGGGDPNGIDPAVLAAQAAQKANCPPGGNPNGGPPIGPTGSAIQGPLYGIVFFNGAMTFRQLDEIAGNMTCPQYAKTIPDPVVAPAPMQTKPEIDTRESTPAVKPEIRTVPTTPKPPNPSTSHDARPRSLELDSGVAQVSSKTRVPSSRYYAKPSTVAAPASTVAAPAEGSGPKSLADLEADVFRKLNLPVPGENKGQTGASANDTSNANPAPMPLSSGATSSSVVAPTGGGSFVPELSSATPNN